MKRPLRGLAVGVTIVVACSGDDTAPLSPDAGPAPLPEIDAGSPDAPPNDTLSGRVLDGTEHVVSGGTVHLVPAADVATLQAKPIDISLSPTDTAALEGDEPLEDLIEKRGPTYPSAAVDATGTYRFGVIAAGTYFVVWTPAPSDRAHAPGAQESRIARSSASLIGQKLDLHVSGLPSDAATYVGSSSCITCHTQHGSVRTAHRNGLQVPGVRGPYQDTSPWPKFDEALAKFDSSVTLYYSACNGAAPGVSKCRVSETDPSPLEVVSFEVRLRTDATKSKGQVGAYYVEIVNRENPGSQRWDVVLTYGGALYKQRFLTRRANANGSFSYLMLPMQFNDAGNVAASSPNDWPWRDDHSARWYDHTTKQLRAADNSDAFDNNCAGCHFTGFKLTGNGSDGWSAHAVPDLKGDFDFDGDGQPEEINTGCESCHGPGSEHVARSTEGGRIVAPSKLTPERETMICGACHSRPRGLGAGGTEAPLSSDNRMPPPGMRRATFAQSFTQRVDAEPSNLHGSGDSRSHHQQYTDFIRSAMYRNGKLLATCSSCHDAHGSDKPHQVTTTGNALCATCHTDPAHTNIREHVTTKTGNPHIHVTDDQFTCVGCHMVKTATSGAQHVELIDQTPSSTQPVFYLHGDISSHRFAVPKTNVASQQPSAASLKCAGCHALTLPNP